MINSSNKVFLLVIFAVAALLGVYFYTRSSGEQPTGEQSALTTPGTGSQVGAPTEASDPTKYQNYSDQAFADEADKRRVLFFHAPWCPTCRPVNLDLLENASRLPDDVVVFKTDYDSSVELKERYGVTYQHTFVQVDGDGNLVTIWNGGGLEEIISKLQ